MFSYQLETPSVHAQDAVVPGGVLPVEPAIHGRRVLWVLVTLHHSWMCWCEW